MNKNIIRKKRLILLFLTYALILTSCPVIPSQTVAASDVVSPRSDDIGWQYKKINGKLYKRLYNFTTKTWIGDWILVG